MHEVRDNKRTIKFDGHLLAFSTSYRPGVKRWIEFGLFRTNGGSYVISRVGETHLYHAPDCAVAQRNGLTKVPPRACVRGQCPGTCAVPTCAVATWSPRRCRGTGAGLRQR